MLQPMFALMCIALLGFSPWAVVYAKELKEYSVGVFVTSLILLLRGSMWCIETDGDTLRS